MKIKLRTVAALAFSLLLSGTPLCTMAQSVIFPQEQQPGVAAVSNTENVYTLSNNLFAANFVKENGTLMFGGCSELGLQAGAELFKVQLRDGSEILASEFTLGEVKIETLTGNPDAVKASRRFNGKQLVAQFTHDSGLCIEWRAVLRDGSHYLRTEVDITTTTDIEMYSIIPMIYTVDNVDGEKAPTVVGNTRGAVIANDKIFAGLETPTGINTAGESTDLESFVYKAWDGASSWGWILDENKDIPADIKNSNNYASGTVHASRGYLVFRETGAYTITFDYTKGNNKLQILGVDLLSMSGEVIAHDYHYGSTGTSDSNNTYTINIPSVGAYMVRYFVSSKGNGEGLSSEGTIAYSKKVSKPTLVYDLASSETPYYTPEVEPILVATATLNAEGLTDSWRAADWVETSDVPQGILSLNFTKEQIRTKELVVDIKQSGKVEITFAYQGADGGGNTRLNLAGADLVDARGNVISYDYHTGYSGNAQSNNKFTIYAPAGTYKVRYFAEKKTEAIQSRGNITYAYGTADAITTEQSQTSTWSRQLPEFKDFTGTLPEGVTVTGPKAVIMEKYYSIAAGELSVNFDWQSGSHGLNILGVEVIDLAGNVLSHDYHVGFTGGTDRNNIYKVYVQAEGTYKVRYIIDRLNNGIDGAGQIVASLTAIDAINAENNTATLHWTQNWAGFSNWTGELPTGVTKNGTAMYMDKTFLLQGGNLEIKFDYTGGSHGLYTLGVQLFDIKGNIVSSHFKNDFTGTSPIAVYNVKIPADGIYKVRYIVDKRNSDGSITNGDIIHTYSAPEATETLPSLGTIDEEETLSQQWTATSWKTIAAELVPNRVNEVGCSDENARVIEQTITIAAKGTLTVIFDYTGGSHKLTVAGVDLVDATGNVSVDDYHVGETGDSDSNNKYTLNVFAPGTYTIRYFANNAESINSTGNISLKLTVDYTLHLISPATTPMQGLWKRKTTLKTNEEWNVSAVVGVIAPGQARRSFLAYSERERAVPWRAVPAYISWYEINIDRNNAKPGEEHINNMDEADCLPILEAWKEQLFDKYGVAPYAFVWDDGWDKYGEWEFHDGFPEGFTNMDKIGRQMGAGQGAWLGPVGGYGTSGGYRRNYWTSTKTGGMQLSNPLYYEVFVRATTNLLHNYGYDFRFFKFDGISGQFSAVGPDNNESGDENAEAIISAERIIRGIKEDTFLNTTVGTWASPFWFQFTDAIWRQEKDYGEIGNNRNDRENWITYRDRLVYQNYVQNSPLCPINTLMTHGFIFTDFSEPKSTSRDWHAVVRELRCAFACGSGMVELYNDYKLTNELANPAGEKGALWGEIAKCMAWQKENADVLPDIHWVGGNPWTGAKAEIYGWAAWNGEKAVLTLRNGANDAQTIKITLREALDIPAYINTTVTFSKAFDDQIALDGLAEGTEIDIDTPLEITLPGSTVYVFDGVDNSVKEIENNKYYGFVDAEGKILRASSDGLSLSDVNSSSTVFVYSPSTLFLLDENNSLLSYSQGLYLNKNAGLEAAGHKGNTVHFKKGEGENTVMIGVANGAYIGSENGEVTMSNTSWTAVEAKMLIVDISAAKYASFYAAVAVKIPEGVAAYYIAQDGVDNENSVVTLTAIEGGVIPAKTGVILYAADITEKRPFCFEIVDDATAIEDNLFEGTLAKSLVENDAYILGISSGKVGLYKTSEFEANGHFTNGGHKAYLPTTETTGPANSVGYTFDFSGTTGISEVESEVVVDEAIFDLTGRKVEKPARGIYIVNGNKTFVK